MPIRDFCGFEGHVPFSKKQNALPNEHSLHSEIGTVWTRVLRDKS
jgi:hypothetical protein